MAAVAKAPSLTYQEILQTVTGKQLALKKTYNVPFVFIKIKDDDVKINKTKDLGRETYVSVFSDGFAIGRVIEYTRSRCTCSPFSENYTCKCVNVDWLIFNAKKTLSNFILAYAIFTNELCESRPPIEIIYFIGPGYYRALVQSELNFVNDVNIPDDIRNAFKHPITTEALNICKKTYNDRSLQNLDIDDPDFPYPEFLSESDSSGDEKEAIRGNKDLEPAAAAASKPYGLPTQSPSITGTAPAQSTDASVDLSSIQLKSIANPPRYHASKTFPISTPSRPVDVKLNRNQYASDDGASRHCSSETFPVSTLSRPVVVKLNRNQSASADGASRHCSSETFPVSTLSRPVDVKLNTSFISPLSRHDAMKLNSTHLASDANASRKPFFSLSRHDAVPTISLKDWAQSKMDQANSQSQQPIIQHHQPIIQHHQPARSIGVDLLPQSANAAVPGMSLNEWAQSRKNQANSQSQGHVSKSQLQEQMNRLVLQQPARQLQSQDPRSLLRPPLPTKEEQERTELEQWYLKVPHMTTEQAKRTIGENMYHAIGVILKGKKVVGLSGKITTMLREALEVSNLLNLLKDTRALKDKVLEALDVIEESGELTSDQSAELAALNMHQ